MRAIMHVDAGLESYVGAALVRIGYLHPEWQVTAAGGVLEIAAGEEFGAEQIRREISYAIYREKIYAETLAMRASFLNAVLRV